MKRTNVIVDEKLLEEARRLSGGRTYSGAISTALQEYVRVERLRESLRTLDELAKDGPIFTPGYLEQIRPNAYAAPGRKRASAMTKRVQGKTKRARRSR